jgi:hypothetical protein
VVYDLEGEKIERARVYFEMPILMRQLGKVSEAVEAVSG